jgi:hypothetical protein
MFRRLFTLTRDGQISVRLDDTMRALLRQATEELREVLLVDEPNLTRRLYPTAYPDDEELEGDYQEMVHDQLLMQRLDGIDQLQASIDDEKISFDVADVWMNTINQLRLVLGTQLDVGEEQVEIDEDDPLATSHVIYQVLSYVLEELTTVRLGSL